MNMTLRRTSITPVGIFGELRSEAGDLMAITLERDYEDDANGASCALVPKVAPGRYVCQRGQHQLLHGGPFETFMITGVPNFEGQPVNGILFHPGNTQADSHGCVLVGDNRAGFSITGSRDAFARFLKCQVAADKFLLTVENK